MLLRWLTPRYPEGCCLYTGTQCAVVSVNTVYWWSLSCDHGLDLTMLVDVRTTTTTTAALEARNFKTACQVYIVDYYCRLCTVVSSIARAHGMLSRRYLLLQQLLLYRLLLCHRLVRHALARSRKKNCAGIQNPKSSPRFSDVFLTSRA